MLSPSCGCVCAGILVCPIKVSEDHVEVLLPSEAFCDPHTTRSGSDPAPTLAVGTISTNL